MKTIYFFLTLLSSSLSRHHKNESKFRILIAVQVRTLRLFLCVREADLGNIWDLNVRLQCLVLVKKIENLTACPQAHSNSQSNFRPGNYYLFHFYPSSSVMLLK